MLEPTSDETLSQRFQKMMREFYDKRKSNKIVVFDDYMLNLLHVLKDDIQAREYVQKDFSIYLLMSFKILILFKWISLNLFAHQI
ncbi:hypothetical protein LQK80_33620 [Bacillus thuringiensis]|nr:hypothetical protein [Bacillus thuringiensis]